MMNPFLKHLPLFIFLAPSSQLFSQTLNSGHQVPLSLTVVATDDRSSDIASYQSLINARQAFAAEIAAGNVVELRSGVIGDTLDVRHRGRSAICAVFKLEAYNNLRNLSGRWGNTAISKAGQDCSAITVKFQNIPQYGPGVNLYECYAATNRMSVTLSKIIKLGRIEGDVKVPQAQYPISERVVFTSEKLSATKTAYNGETTNDTEIHVVIDQENIFSTPAGLTLLKADLYVDSKRYEAQCKNLAD